MMRTQMAFDSMPVFSHLFRFASVFFLLLRKLLKSLEQQQQQHSALKRIYLYFTSALTESILLFFWLKRKLKTFAGNKDGLGAAAAC